MAARTAQRVVTLLGSIITVLAILREILNAVVLELPDHARSCVTTATVTVTFFALVLTRIQVVLTRARVWSPASIDATSRSAALSQSSDRRHIYREAMLRSRNSHSAKSAIDPSIRETARLDSRPEIV